MIMEKTIRLSNKNFNKNEVLHELYLTQRQMTKLIDKIKKNISTDIKLSKVQINKILKERGNLGKLLMGFSPKLIKPAISLGKNILAPLGLSAAMSATDAAIQKEMYGSRTTILIISDNDVNDMIKIVKALEDSDVLLKGITKTIKNETKEQKGGFLSKLLGTLGASLLGNLLSGQNLYRTGYGMYRTGYRLKKKSLIPFHPLKNYEIKNYFKDEPRFNGVYSRDNLSKLKNGAYVFNLDHSENTGRHWVVIFVQKDEVIYFESFGVEHIPKEIKKSIGNKNIKTSIQSYDSVMCGYFCILFIEYMLNNKTLTDFTKFFSPWNFKKNDEIIKRHFK